MLEKCVLTVLELNWNKRLGHKKTKLNICHHMLTSSTQLQNRSFHVVERTRTSSKCQKMKYARAKRAKILFFIVKYANLWGFCCRRRRGCLSSLLKIDCRNAKLHFQMTFSLPSLKLPFKKLRRQLQRKRWIKIQLSVKLSVLRLFHVVHVVQNRRTALSLAWDE